MEFIEADESVVKVSGDNSGYVFNLGNMETGKIYLFKFIGSEYGAEITDRGLVVHEVCNGQLVT